MGGVAPPEGVLLRLRQPEALGAPVQGHLRLLPELKDVQRLQGVQVDGVQRHRPEAAGAGGVDEKPLRVAGGDEGCPPDQHPVRAAVGQAVLVPLGGDEGLEPLQVAAQGGLQLPQLHNPRRGAAPEGVLVLHVQPLSQLVEVGAHPQLLDQGGLADALAAVEDQQAVRAVGPRVLVAGHGHTLHQPLADEDSGQGVPPGQGQDGKQLLQPVLPVPPGPLQQLQHGVEPAHPPGDPQQVRHLVLAAPEHLLEVVVENDVYVRRQGLRVVLGGDALDPDFLGDHVVAHGNPRVLQKSAQQLQGQGGALVLLFLLRVLQDGNAPLFPALHRRAQLLHGDARFGVGLDVRDADAVFQQKCQLFIAGHCYHLPLPGDGMAGKLSPPVQPPEKI